MLRETPIYRLILAMCVFHCDAHFYNVTQMRSIRRHTVTTVESLSLHKYVDKSQYLRNRPLNIFLIVILRKITTSLRSKFSVKNFVFAPAVYFVLGPAI